jgi:hypothetical protein
VRWGTNQPSLFHDSGGYILLQGAPQQPCSLLFSPGQGFIIFSH